MVNKNKKSNILLILFVTAIIILSTFTVITFSQMSDISNKINNNDNEPSVVIITDKTSGFPPFTVNFSSIITNEYGKISYLWDFGDGTTSEEKEPSHTYNSNKSLMCTLAIKTENGKEYTDSIKITSLVNQPPKASVILSSTTPNRDFSWKIPHLILRWSTKTMGGRKLYYMKQLKIAPMSSAKSNINALALAPDPEGDKIVSYKWELKPPTITLIGNKPHHDNHIYYGKNVTFDLLDIYATGKYDLILTVEDEHGNIDTEMSSFKVEENPIEQKTFGFLQRQKNQWLTQYSGIDFIWTFVVGTIGWLLYKNIIAQRVSLPILKLFVMGILTLLKIDPEDYGDESMIVVLSQILDKYDFLKPITLKAFNKIESFLIKIGNEEKAEELQILEEEIGLDNKRPVLKDQFPNNNDENIPRKCPYVSINVTDPESDTFDVKISGDYLNETVYNYVTNGTFKAFFNHPSSEGLPGIKDINWNVEIIDQNDKIVTESYKFTTFA